MDNVLFKSYKVEERSYVSFIKREIHNLIITDFKPKRTAEIDIVISEVTSNLIKHAGAGELLYRLSEEDEQPVFEIICIDKGPGIKDLKHAMKDGVSTSKTLGQGIGAITRLSNFSQIYTQPENGTIVYCRFNKSRDYTAPKTNIVVRSLNVPIATETVSGDNMAIRYFKTKTLIFAGDGLGHGPNAKEAVDGAIAVFKESMTADPCEMIREMHRHVKKTRGLVGTVAILDHVTKKWEICGVGNISTRLQNGLEYKNYVSNNGVIGLNIPTRLQNTIMMMEKYQLLICCSDGIKTSWDLAKYPSILKFDPMIIAAVLYKDHNRRTDDSSILIVKIT
ncbi:MAG: hypothetical protein JWO32_409 [Bacteroidetes bacterium]|nr:hypothetical protein [Bacteroidota bacterium]